MKKGGKFLFLVLLASLFLFWGSFKKASALVLIADDVTSPEIWTKENSPYIIQNVITIKAPLIIEPGTVVKFQNFESDDRPTIPGMHIESEFTAVGDALEKIVFTTTCDDAHGGDTSELCSKRDPHWAGSWSSISVDSKSRFAVVIEYAEIFYATKGIAYYASSDCNQPHRELSVRHTQISFSSIAGVSLFCTQPVLDNLILANNYDGISVPQATCRDNYLIPKIRNSAIFNNKSGARGYLFTCLDARYNYWGDSSGPAYNQGGFAREAPNINGLGNRIVGTGVLFRPWSQSDPSIPKEPVIFIPGIGASINPDLMISGALADNWTMFDHTYDGILQAFKTMGYQEDKTFFLAYYDWRQSNQQSVETYLKPLIRKALTNSGADRVNIVTHSMGSLVARSYVQSADYANEVDNLIMIAPPNKGSSDVYDLWEGGRIPSSWGSKGILMKIYLSYLTIATLGTSNFFDTIHQHIPSLKDLMPAYDFLFPKNETQNLKSHLSMNEQNNFLLALNQNSEVLSAKTRLSIILGDKQPTVNKIPIIASDQTGLWSDGKPDPIDPARDDDGGDGEVLKVSGNISSDFLDVLEYGHSEIVSKSEKIVAERLGQTLDYTFNSPEIEDEMIVWTDAPAELEVVDGEGSIAPKDNNEDTDVRYAQEKNKDGFKIISVPNVKKGTYEISFAGNADGTYHLGINYVDHKKENGNQEISQTIEIQKDQTQKLTVEIDPQSETAPMGELQPKDETAPNITLDSPEDGKEYANDQISPISFSVSDDFSVLEDMQIEKYLDGELIEGNTLDFSKLTLGEHDLWIEVVDEAGNWNMAEAFFTVVEAVEQMPGDNVADPPMDNDDSGTVIEKPAGDSGENEAGPASEVAVVDPAAVAVPAQIVALTTSSKKHKNNKPQKTATPKKFIQGGGVTKSNEKIKILSSSSFNLSPQAEVQQNLFYSELEQQLKDELVRLDQNAVLSDGSLTISVAAQNQIAEISFDFSLPKWKDFFATSDTSSKFGIYQGMSKDSNFSAEAKNIQKNIEQNRLALLAEFLLAIATTIFFGLSPLSGYKKIM